MIPRRRRTSTVTVGWAHPVSEEEYEVECSVTPGDPGRLSGPPEKCYPPEPPEVDLLRVFDAEGKERPDLIERISCEWDVIEEKAIEEAEEQAIDAYEAACEADSDARRDAR